MKKAVFFDFDGTLFFKTEEINLFCINRALNDFGRPDMTEAQLLSTVGATLDDIAKLTLLEDYPAKRDRFLECILSYLPGAIAEVASMEEAGIRMLKRLSQETSIAICSNAVPEYLFPLLDKFGVKKYFKYIWHYKEGFTKKTAIPQIKKFLRCDEAVMVGDRLEDIEAGRATGCVTVAIRGGGGLQDAQNADYTVYCHDEMLDLLLKII